MQSLVIEVVRYAMLAMQLWKEAVHVPFVNMVTIHLVELQSVLNAEQAILPLRRDKQYVIHVHLVVIRQSRLVHHAIYVRRGFMQP